MHIKMCAVYGEGAVTDQMCQKWFVKFCAGDFSLDDAQIIQINKVIEKCVFYFTEKTICTFQPTQ